MAHKYILDTHALVWYLEGSTRLSNTAKILIDDVNNQLILPFIALAETTFLIERGRTKIPTVVDLIHVVQPGSRIEIYPLTWEVFQQSLVAASIPEIHDRLIVATALHLQQFNTVSLVTRDETITKSGLIPVDW